MTLGALRRGVASGKTRKPSYMLSRRSHSSDLWGLAAMIYILAFFIPPLGLLLNGQVFSAVLNFFLLVPCLLLGFLFPLFWALPSAHAIIAIYMSREDRKHRQVVDAIERHGPPPAGQVPPPPWWRS
jgi:hypothetical protein